VSGEELRGLAEEHAALRRVATLVARGTPAEELFGAVTGEVGQLLGAHLAGRDADHRRGPSVGADRRRLDP